MARLGKLAVLAAAIQLAKLELGLTVAGTCRLAQQLETDTAIALAVTVVTQQPTQPTLCFNHTFERRLLEHSTGDTFDTFGLS